MSRVQLAFDVSDLNKAVAFCSTQFSTPPATIRPGDATFAIDGPVSDEGLESEMQDQIPYCSAVQEEVWVNEPDGAPGEIFTVLADAPSKKGSFGSGTLCIPEAFQSTAFEVGVEQQRQASLS
jgi:hypothetical protein